MKIGKFAKLTGISPYTLRFYEKNQLIRVQRDLNGRRYYGEGDVEWAKFLQRLKNTGMPLKEIRTYAEWRYEGSETVSLRLALLEKHRLYVVQEKIKWETYLNNLNEKIEHYRVMLDKK